MAIITGTATTFAGSPGMQGLRESLADVIYLVSPDTTPFLSSIGRGSAEAVLEEWQVDALAAPNLNNANFQGDDITSFSPASVTSRLGNRTQIFRKEVIISATLDAVSKAGRKTERAYQMSKRSREIKIDIESILLSNQAKVTGAAATAPKLASVLSWIKTNVSHVGTNPTGDGSDARVDGTPRALTESMMATVLQSIFTNSSEDIDVLMVGASNKKVVSGFAGGAQKTVDVMEKKTVATVDIYVGDFHTFRVIANRFMRPRDALFLNYGYWEMAWLRPLAKTDLAKTGDAEKMMLVGEGTLKAKNEAANGGIFDLTAP